MMDGKRYVAQGGEQYVGGMYTETWDLKDHLGRVLMSESEGRGTRDRVEKLAALLNRLQADSDELARIRAEAPRVLSGLMHIPDIRDDTRPGSIPQVTKEFFARIQPKETA